MAPFFDTNGDPLMDPYTILCIPSTASESEIKKAYRMQMLQLHPDKLEPTLSENSIAAVTETFHNVKDAYEFLMSPVHLTSRRLYMAKMASRRAEYERREAYIRRHGGSSYSSSGGGSSNNMNSRAHTVPNNYSRGGGGAAGIAGTGMPRSSSNSGTAHAQRMRNMHRSQSEPGIQNNNINNRGKQQQQQRSGGDNQARYYRGSNNQNMMHNSHRTGGGHRDHRNGYKSDGSVYGARRSKSRDYDRRHSNKTTHNQHHSARHERRRETRERQQHRSRGKSEPRRYKSTAATATAAQDNKRTTWDKFVQGKSQRRSRSRDAKEKKRRRARSAPARYAKSSSRGRDRYTNNKSKKDLPSNFYCPLTKRVYKDPVIDSEGNTYEREAIERWLRSQSSSPVTNNYLCVEMLKPNRELKRTIYKATGKPRSKSQSRPPKYSPSQEFSSGRVLVDSYLHEISNNSKLTVSLDGMGICAFKYRRITFVIEVPIDEHAGFMVYSSFDGEADTNAINKKIDAWNNWLSHIGRSSQVSYVKAGQKTVFTLKGNEFDMDKCNIFQKTLEYFIEMSLKLHNLLHPNDGMKKSVENVCLTKTPVSES